MFQTVQFSSHFQNAIIYLPYFLHFFLYAFLLYFLLLFDGGPLCGMFDDRLFETEATLIQVLHCLVLTLHIVFLAVIHRFQFLAFLFECLFNVKGLMMPVNSMSHSWSVCIPVAVNYPFGETVSTFYTWIWTLIS